MDWSKAKNILIVALIATNIFLFATYVNKNIERSINGGEDRDALVAVLKDKGVEVDGNVPAKQGRMPMLTLSYENLEYENIRKLIEKDSYTVASREMEDYCKVAENFLWDCGLLKGDMIFDSGDIHGNGDANLRYCHTYNNIPIAVAMLEIEFVDGRIVNVGRQDVSYKAKGQKRLETISPEEALLVFMTEKEKAEQIKIESMDMVFWVDDRQFEGEERVSDTAFPAWRIRYNGGKVKYINASRA